MQVEPNQVYRTHRIGCSDMLKHLAENCIQLEYHMSACSFYLVLEIRYIRVITISSQWNRYTVVTGAACGYPQGFRTSILQ